MQGIAGAGSPEVGIVPASPKRFHESLPGIRLEGDQLRLNPRLPRAWESLRLDYRHRDIFYHINVQRAEGEVFQTDRPTIGGQEQPGATIQLVDNRREHAVEVWLGDAFP